MSPGHIISQSKYNHAVAACREVAMAHVCPWWIGFFLLSPLRKIRQNPDRILGPLVRAGMTVLEIGPGMGFFSIPLARIVGERGRVVCVDMQEKMLSVLKRRAAKAGVSPRIESRLCGPDSLGIDDLDGAVDFALIFAMVHEVPDRAGLFRQVWKSLKPGGTALFAEPRGHESARGFNESLDIASSCGFGMGDKPNIWGSRSMVLVKK